MTGLVDMGAATARAAALNAPLATARLSLVPLLGGHADALFPILTDPDTRRWIPPLKARSVEALRERWGAIEGRCSPDGTEAWLAWAVRRDEDGAWLGKLDANVVGPAATNLGYVFGPAAWGHGYATEAVGAVVEHFLRAGMTELRATVTVGNEASCRVLERLQFVRAGVLVGNETLHGVPHDDVLFVRRA